jgi:hypothetical protein
VTAGADPESRAAFESMAGRSGLAAVGQNESEFPLDVVSLEDDTVIGLVPRMRLVGVEQVTVRFAEDGRPWRAQFDLQKAELHSDEQALVTLRLLEIVLDGSGRVAPRAEVHAPGMLTAGHCRNIVRGNEYSVRVDDVSGTGFQFTSEVELAPGDEFSVVFEAGGRKLVLDGKAISIAPGPYGRHVIGARITGSGPGDLRTISEMAGGG